MEKGFCDLVPGGLYHMRNEAVGGERIFRERRDYVVFLLRLEKFSAGVFECLYWHLQPWRFDLVVRVRPVAELREQFVSCKPEGSFWQGRCSDFLMERVANWLNSYAKTYNMKYARKGALFIDYTRRFEMKGEEEIDDLIRVMAEMDMERGLVRVGERWRWSMDLRQVMG